MKPDTLLPHLFRTEYRKVVAVLCKRFGFEQIEIAEDLASDTFMTATHAWGLEGIPQNPTAWLYHVAKNKAKNYLQRQAIFENNVCPEIQNSASGFQEMDIDLSPQNILDSQLQMMFAICHPAISTEAQIGLSLRILCGFGIEEIADAFLTNKEVIYKRLFRAKEKLREENIRLELPQPSELEHRLETVLTTIYLLFNEGYYSGGQNQMLRKDLCLEAIRLCTMLIEFEPTNLPPANALLALMCFHASRFEARLDTNGALVLYEDQDTKLWNADWIAKGVYFLNRAAQGNKISKYHLEAGIAYRHTQASDTQEKWENILDLYNRLLQFEYSPVAALNRTYALSKVRGKEAALREAEKLHLPDNHLYYLLLGELYAGINPPQALQALKKALQLTKNDFEKQTIQKKIDGVAGKF